MGIHVAERRLTLSEIFEGKPKRYEVTRDGRFTFVLGDGERVRLACDACANTFWDIRFREEKERKYFLLHCHNCEKGIYAIWIEPLKETSFRKIRRLFRKVAS